MTSQTFELDLIPQGVPPVVHVSQYDRGQVWFIEVLENGVPYEIPTGCAVTIQGSKPDNTAFQYACTYSGNIVAAVLMQQMCAVVGDVSCEVRITANDAAQIIGSLNFIIEVEEGSIADDTIISETDISLIEQAIELAERVPEIIQECQEYVNESSDFADYAEKYAAGTVGGQTVGSTDPAYHNNAKWYKEQADADAQTAVSNKEDAEAYAVGTRNGTTVTSSDETYHNNAKYYSQQASTSATNSANSAIASSDSAQDAEAYAKGTRNGVDVTSSDATYHNNSKYFSEQASTSATNAGNSATSASNSATLAESYAKGGTNSRTGEDTDNAKWYMEQAQAAAGGAGASDFTGATASANGIHGLVPQPLIADRAKYLKGDGNWSVPSAEEASYSNTSSGLSATNIQAAIDEVKGITATNATAISNNATAIAKCEVLKIEVASFSSLPQTISNSSIESDMVCIHSELSAPEHQLSDWTVDTSNGSLAIGGIIDGSTTLTLYLMKSR